MKTIIANAVLLLLTVLIVVPISKTIAHNLQEKWENPKETVPCSVIGERRARDRHEMLKELLDN